MEPQRALCHPPCVKGCVQIRSLCCLLQRVGAFGGDFCAIQVCSNPRICRYVTVHLAHLCSSSPHLIITQSWLSPHGTLLGASWVQADEHHHVHVSLGTFVLQPVWAFPMYGVLLGWCMLCCASVGCCVPSCPCVHGSAWVFTCLSLPKGSWLPQVT